MAMIGQKIGFGPDWPQLAHLGGQKEVLELTFTKSDSKFQNNLTYGPSGAKMGTHFLAIGGSLEVTKVFPFMFF